MKVGAKTTILPLRSNLVSVGWVGEGDQDSLSNSQYGQPLLTLKKIQVTVPVTHEELIDSGVSIVDQISSDVAEAFAQKEGEGYVNGTASPTQPQGFMNPGAITQETNSGNATQLTWQSMSEVTGKIKTGYRPIYGFNRFTRANLLQMVDGVGRPLWQAGNIAAGIPNTINGYSYIELPNMADIGAGNYPVVFGDFAKGYVIGDGIEMRVIRDDYTSKREGKVEFTFYRRTTGLVRLAEAFAKIKISS